jgi:hypothetical protein
MKMTYTTTLPAIKTNTSGKDNKSGSLRKNRKNGKRRAVTAALKKPTNTALASRMSLLASYHAAVVKPCNWLKKSWYSGLVFDKHGDSNMPALLSDWPSAIGEEVDVIEGGSIFYEINTIRRMVNFYWIEKATGKRVYLDTFSYDLLARETLMYQLRKLSKQMNELRQSNKKDSAKFSQAQADYNRLLDVMALYKLNREVFKEELDRLSKQWAKLNSALEDSRCGRDEIMSLKKEVHRIEHNQRILLHALRHFPPVLKKVKKSIA